MNTKKRYIQYQKGQRYIDQFVIFPIPSTTKFTPHGEKKKEKVNDGTCRTCNNGSETRPINPLSNFLCCGGRRKP
jgi:hypothetical protein